MTNTALHRAAPTFKRYRTASEQRRRHRMTSLISEVRHGKERPRNDTAFGWVIFGTLLACWAIIGGALWGLSIHSTPETPVKSDSLESVMSGASDAFGSLTTLDPSILANLHSVTLFKENHK